MIKFPRRILILTFSIISIIGLSSCNKDGDEADRPSTDVDKGSIFPNKVVFNLTKTNDTSYTRSFTYYAPSGGSVSIDTILFPMALNASLATYDCTLEFFNDNINRTSEIRSLGRKYMICFRDFNFFDLSATIQETDADGNDLALTTEWKAKKKFESGSIRMTMNYNQQPKSGSCDAGSLVSEVFFPFKIIEE